MLATAMGRPLWGQTNITASPSCPRTTFRHWWATPGTTGGVAFLSGNTSYHLTDSSIILLSFFGASGGSPLPGCGAPPAPAASNDETRHPSTTPTRVRLALRAFIAVPL